MEVFDTSNPECKGRFLNDSETLNSCMDFVNQSIALRKYPLLQTDRWLAIVYIVTMATALLVGTCGNTLIILVSAVVKGVNKSGKEFIVNLALADFCVTAIADPLCIIGVAKGEQFFDDKKWLCESVASLCLTACFCAFLSLTLLTLSRYIYLCHNHIYDKIFTRVSCIIICVISWVVAFLFEFPNFIGWGGHYFDQKNHQCIWDRTASLSYTMFVSIGLIGGPLLVMAICYFLIFQEIWKTKRDIYKLDSENPNRMRKAWNETVRSSKTLFCIFVVFLICWTPYAVTVTLDMQNNFSTEIHLFITLLAHFHSSVNCIIYTTGNKRFRMGILRCFGCTSSQKSFCSNPDVISKKTHSGSSNTPSLNSDSSSPQITKSSSLSTISVSVTSSPP
ncbi:melatonin receptor type 1B-like [Ostrea edulis]|uniref:melatonin receptor type 1B-like n=1 Tax=Ostrea edulis TaxID=37623 RepID=UPI0020953EF6|nr:melatonin receptor type 1B-like [Ostrea edulis]